MPGGPLLLLIVLLLLLLLLMLLLLLLATSVLLLMVEAVRIPCVASLFAFLAPPAKRECSFILGSGAVVGLSLSALRFLSSSLGMQFVSSPWRGRKFGSWDMEGKKQKAEQNLEMGSLFSLYWRLLSKLKLRDFRAASLR
jgi:hypothetical protein